MKILIYLAQYITYCNICLFCIPVFSALVYAGDNAPIVVVEPDKPGGGGEGVRTGDDDDDDDDDDGDEALFRSASLENDPETETLLARAGEFIASRQFDTAVRLLQKVIDGNDAILVRAGDGVYIPARRRAEDLIAALPAEGLELYRVAADAEAEALLSEAESRLDSDSLKNATQKFFMSSKGDEAAFMLACIYIDSGRLQKAFRLLTDLLSRYPDLSVSRKEVLLRQAYACAQLGDLSAARKSLKQIAESPTGYLRKSSIESVEKAVTAMEDAEKSSASTTSDADAGSALLASTGLGTVWSLTLPVTVRKNHNVRAFSIPGRTTKKTVAPAKSELEKLVNRWKGSNWFPADQTIIHRNFLYISCLPDLVCVDLSNGQIAWKSHLPEKKPKGTTRSFNYYYGRQQMSQLENFAFGNRVARALSMHGGIIYRIEKHLSASLTSRAFGRQPAGAVGNRLVAYDSKSGSPLWNLGLNPDSSSEFHAVRFLSAPVACSGSILVPVERKDGLTLYSLDPRTGKIRWRRFVCAYLAGQSPTADKVAITVDGSSVFLGTGEGVVMAFDGIDGTIYWASQYERQPPPSNAYWHRRQNTDKRVGGWDDNTLICSGNTLVLLPSDADAIIGFDRETGARLYRIKQGECKYSPGQLGERLLVAGRKEIRCHKVSSGEVVWSRVLPSSYGRGTLIGSRIALPTEEGLLILDSDSGKAISTVKAGVDGDMPLGNIFLSEKLVLFLGANRLFALRDRETHLADLNAAVKTDGSCRAYADRGSFFLLLGEFQGAVEDLRKAIDLTENSESGVRYGKVTAEIDRINKDLRENMEILKVSGTTVFTDDFERDELGENWTTDKVNVKIDKGAIVLNVKDKKKDKITRYRKELTGDFRVEYDGWQNTGRLCDLSLMMYLKKPDNTETSIDIAFGANLNVRNMIVHNRRRVTETTDYLMKRGKKHHLVVMRIGNRIVMTADGIVVHDYENSALGLKKDSRYQLGLYGWDSEHFFDNFKVALISPEEVASVNEARQKKLKKIDALRAELVDIRGRGYVKPGSIKASLFKALMSLAREKPAQALALIEEARGIAATEKDRLSVAFAEAEAKEKNNDPLGAARSYISLLDNSGASLLPFKDDDNEHKVTVREVMVRNLARLNQNHGMEVEKFISGVIDEKFEALKTKGDAKGIWNLYCAFPEHKRAAEIGLAAAEMAKCSDGSPSIAVREAALMAMTASRKTDVAATALHRLAQLYDKQEWPVLARRAWLKLKDRYGNVKISANAGQRDGRALADDALVDRKADVKLPGMPSPPYKLLWKSDTQLRIHSYAMNADAVGFRRKHMAAYDYRTRRFRCMNIRTGKFVWETPSSGGSMQHLISRNRYNAGGNRQHMLYARVGAELHAYDMPAGKMLWRTNGTANQIWDGEGLVVTMLNMRGEMALSVLDAVTGDLLWQRQMRGYYQFSIVDGMIVGYGRNMSFGGAGGEQACTVFDGRTGRKVRVIKTNPGVNIFTDVGFVCQDGNTVSCHSFADGKLLWSSDIDEGSRLQSLNNSEVFAVTGAGKLSLHDLGSGKKLWTTKIETAEGVVNFRPVLNRGGDEILVYTYSNKKQNLFILNRDTGRILDYIEPSWDRQQGQWLQHLGVGERFVPVMITDRKMKGNRTLSYRRFIRFVERNSGKFAAGVVLPKEEDAGKAPNHTYYQLAVVGDTMLLTGSGKTFAYVHDDKGPEIELEDLKLPEKKPEAKKVIPVQPVPMPQPLLNKKVEVEINARVTRLKATVAELKAKAAEAKKAGEVDSATGKVGK